MAKNLISFEHKGNFNKIDRFLSKWRKFRFTNKLKKYGELGVEALRDNTPKDSGLTAESWGYAITENDNSFIIDWVNNSDNKGFNIAIGLQYGHGTNRGGFVQGVDYINPALKPIFEQILKDIWNEIESS